LQFFGGRLKRVRELEIWNEAMVLVKRVYAVTREFPKEEVYGLSSQVRRAVVSVPANLAEGVGRGGNAELARFAQIALGSAYELETLLQIAVDLEYIDATRLEPLNNDLERLTRRITTFMNRVKSKPLPSSDF
jgi:four helix bundle protein